MQTPIRRVGTPIETEWIVYGSYVLDVVFGLTQARDLDVGFNPQLRQPTECEICQHLTSLSLPTPPSTIQRTRCHDFSVPEGGGFPCFNIDFWQLHMDGNVYVAEPHTHSHHMLDDNVPHTLVVSDPEHLTADRVTHALEKMQRYPDLYTDEVAEQLQNIT